ncbi:hypothetical protein TNIN_94681 [Trichonephila inaurata madagascariensis]|uniref:Uncharacterized protein n=1 Tax=Trichonephila inaurata madagascariensis TaxID=2747483 RepID=A0A8X6JP02_9ARAC|nr:hypothetical protein TNIN_94681 [Trichonephila inaurata madagascariensis]
MRGITVTLNFIVGENVVFMWMSKETFKWNLLQRRETKPVFLDKSLKSLWKGRTEDKFIPYKSHFRMQQIFSMCIWTKIWSVTLSLSERALLMDSCEIRRNTFCRISSVN